MAWPTCFTEDQTLDMLVLGMSIARFGDGEFGCAFGKGNTTHAANPRHAEELKRILVDPTKGCLPSIPTMNMKDERVGFWTQRLHKYSTLLNMKFTYGSAFVGRTKSAPWIATDEYAEKFRSIWAGKTVTAVASDPVSITKMLRRNANMVHYVQCPLKETYLQKDRIINECLDTKCDVVILACGPAATVIADQLTKHGIQAIDLGRGVKFLMRQGPKI